MRHADFTELAEAYAAYRPGYSRAIVDVLTATVSRGGDGMEVADIGAGTGIWSRELARAGCVVTAVEPNDAMRARGEVATGGLRITWRKGSAEATGLHTASCDLVSMASAFHWADFDRAVAEFDRVLRPHGYFVALWNPRAVERNPLLQEIEATLHRMVPELKRMSSGRSEFCDRLHDRLLGCEVFQDVVYLEAFHVEKQTRERYLGLWNSVNDVQVQAGPARFERFMQYVAEVTRGIDVIDAAYQTRAWLARK